MEYGDKAYELSVGEMRGFAFVERLPIVSFEKNLDEYNTYRGGRLRE